MRIRVALVTNIPAPYRIPVFNRVARDPRIDLLVVFCAGSEPNRDWDLERFEFKSVTLRESFVTVGGRYIHNNLDVFVELKKFAPHVVITTGFNPTYLYAFLYALLRGCEHVCMTDGTIASERQLSVWHKLLRRIVYNKSATFVGASDSSLQLLRSYNCALDRVYKSHLCVDNERFSAALHASKCFDLMFCGRFSAGKHPLLVLDVAERAAALLNRRISVLYVGGGELEGEVREHAHKQCQVDAHVYGPALQSDLPGLYAASRIFLFPTSADVWGVVANEACASGLPIIATPHAGCVGEIIKPGVNAFVHDFDVNVWADYVAKLLTNERLYMEFAERSREAVKEHTFDAAAAGIVSAALSAHNV